MAWTKVLKTPLKFSTVTKITPTKGNLVYEYNPLRNYRLNENKYYFREEYYSLQELLDKFNIIPSKDKKSWVDATSNKPITETEPILYSKGQLVDFDTNELKLSIKNPVTMLPLYSYDGSVNLVINDGLNTPRLINSRFSATGKNTYEVIDRKGNNDTNIYDLGEQFDIDTSLYKRVIKIPKINFINVQSGGNLKVGNYHFYFKLADADGNETDFVGESGLVSIFIGYSSPRAIHTGQKNENSLKSVKFIMSNIDTAYDCVNVYYSRDSAEGSELSITEYAKIEKKFLINSAAEANILITGDELITELTLADINLFYSTVDAAKASTTCQNMLFLGNVHKPDIPYNKLSDLSLRFLPYVKEEVYPLQMDENYRISTATHGYYDTKFIYNNVGYWNNEFYRVGIVYILPNNELTPVFNIRGRYKVKPFNSNIHFDKNLEGVNDGQYNHYNVYTSNGTYNTIKIKESTNYVIDPADENEGKKATDKSYYENAKGVISFNAAKDSNIIYSLDVRTDSDTIKELLKYVKGYFFVRQKRIPTILALGITIGIDEESHTPTIPTASGFLTELSNSLKNSFVETEDINDVNYISEGFLSRYTYSIVPKSSHFWKEITNTFLKAAVITAALVGTAMLVPPVAAFVAPIAAKMGIVGLGALIAAVSTAGALAGGAVGSVGTIITAGVDELINVIKRTTETVKLEGRNSKIPSGYRRKEDKTSRQLSEDFYNRIIIKDNKSNKILGLLCPDYEVNPAYYNSIFTGNEHVLRTTISQNINSTSGYSTSYFTNSKNHFYVPAYIDTSLLANYLSKIIAVPDDTRLIGLEDLKFRSRAGDAENACEYECISKDYKSEETRYTNEEDKTTQSNKEINSDIIRGSFGAYLGISNFPNLPATTVDILVPNYSDASTTEYINARMSDFSEYYAISDRFDISEIHNYALNLSIIDTSNLGYQWVLHRGDCYICQFTHRINRNFNDPSAPYNDEIVDKYTWKDNYSVEDTEKQANINRGDINAVKLGMWITFRVRSASNLNIRTLDGSRVEETAMMGHPRGYYPNQNMITEGSYKCADSEIYNNGFSKDLSSQIHFELPNVPYIKNWFGTRIMYSDLNVNDAFKNGYRTFLGSHYRDYTREYGEIVKLVSLNSNIICVFEHGIALLTLNQQALTKSLTGQLDYINAYNILPEDPKIISDTIGSQWAESVLKTPGKAGNTIQYVYGVDTVAKKIWRTDGNSLECISDFKVLKFLNDNITLGERELTPFIGVRNVKTVYNSFKHDVMFTFYDNTYGFEEKVWNLCWNELLLKFITFYSWVPSYMENINNIPFSFNRDTSKYITKLGTSHLDSSIADGITLTNVLFEHEKLNNLALTSNLEFTIPYFTKKGELKILKGHVRNTDNFIGVLSLSNRILPEDINDYLVDFTLEPDAYNNYKNFEIVPVNCTLEDDNTIYNGSIILPDDAKYAHAVIPIYCLKAKVDPKLMCSEIYYRNKAGHLYADDDNNKIDTKNGIQFNYPIFKDRTGKRPNLPIELQINEDRLVILLNIKAHIKWLKKSENDIYNNMLATYAEGSNLIDVGNYESVVAISPKWNLQFLTTDFWKHGLAGIIDITDNIYPTYWYGKQHPFEFECVVVDNLQTHKIFTNLELIANKAKPESFHYEIVGEAYDFVKDKPNMYFRQEAMKALWQYNGANILYNRDFLKVLPLQLVRSADMIHRYYTRQLKINNIEDYYVHITYPEGYDYRHLSGGELIYYPNTQEYRIWNHTKAVDLNSLSQEDARSLIISNCQYIEDRWKIKINPLIICYKNEYDKNISTWVKGYKTNGLLPTLPLYNSPVPDIVLNKNELIFPKDNEGVTNALYNLYDTNVVNNWNFIDTTNWLNDNSIYNTAYGLALNRLETDLRDRFVKVRIRYTGDELAIIDLLKTFYRISYA